MHRVTKVLVWTLLVIGALVIIAAVLMPVFSRARYKAHSVAGMAPSAEMRMAEQSVEYEYAGEEVADATKSAAPSSVLITEAAAATVDRQIIYNASLSLETRNTGKVRQQIEALAGKTGGYVSDSESWVDEAGRQQINFTVRVPVKQFSNVMSQIRALGKVKHESIDTQDVTEEFLDLDARLRTLRQAEERLLAMLKRSGKLADLLAIERELAGRRGEIERAEGRLRYLMDRVGFSTITVSLYEEGTAAVGPSGPYDVVYHLRTAHRVLISILQGLLTALIYIVIGGVVVWLPLLVLIWVIVRRRRRHQA